MPRWPSAGSKCITWPPSPVGRHTAATGTIAGSAAMGLVTAIGMVTAMGLGAAMGQGTAMGQATATGTGTSTGRPVTVTATWHPRRTGRTSRQ